MNNTSTFLWITDKGPVPISLATVIGHKVGHIPNYVTPSYQMFPKIITSTDGATLINAELLLNPVPLGTFDKDCISLFEEGDGLSINIRMGSLRPSALAPIFVESDLWLKGLVGISILPDTLAIGDISAGIQKGHEYLNYLTDFSNIDWEAIIPWSI